MTSVFDSQREIGFVYFQAIHDRHSHFGRQIRSQVGTRRDRKL